MSYQGYQHGPHGFGGSSRNLTGGGSSQQSDLVNTTQPSTHNDHLSAYSPHQSYPDPRLQPSFADTQPPGSGNASVYMLIVEQTFSGDPPPPSTHRVEFNNTDWNAGRHTESSFRPSALTALEHPPMLVQPDQLAPVIGLAPGGRPWEPIRMGRVNRGRGRGRGRGVEKREGGGESGTYAFYQPPIPTTSQRSLSRGRPASVNQPHPAPYTVSSPGLGSDDILVAPGPGLVPGHESSVVGPGHGRESLPPPSLVTAPDGPIGDRVPTERSVASEETNFIPGNAPPGRLSFLEQVLNPEPATKRKPALTEEMLDSTSESGDELEEQQPAGRRSSSSGGIEPAGGDIPEFGLPIYQGPWWLNHASQHHPSRKILDPEAVPNPDPDLTKPEEKGRMAADRERMARALAKLDQVRDPTQDGG